MQTSCIYWRWPSRSILHTGTWLWHHHRRSSRLCASVILVNNYWKQSGAFDCSQTVQRPKIFMRTRSGILELLNVNRRISPVKRLRTRMRKGSWVMASSSYTFWIKTTVMLVLQRIGRGKIWVSSSHVWHDVHISLKSSRNVFNAYGCT
jgi:hypothetical protein